MTKGKAFQLKLLKHKHVGPGGILCACCNPYHGGGSQKTTKKYFNRKIRRASKEILRDLEE